MIQGLHHLKIDVADLERSLRFYRDQLGFHEIARYDVPKGPTIVQVSPTGTPPGIELWYEPPFEGLHNDRLHFAFQATDVPALARELEAKGVSIEREPFKIGNEHIFFVRDPDGYLLEFNEMRQPGAPALAGPGFSLIGAEERTALLEVFDRRHLSRYRFADLGDSLPTKVYDFERYMEEVLGVRYCLAMSSCTDALLVGLWASGIGRGAEVIVPGYTFIASIAAVAYAGAVPILAEIDESLTLDPDDVARKITPRTRAIMAVHMLGTPCRMDVLVELAERHGILLVEDCAQAGGGRFRGRALGTFGAFGAFSLNVFKTFTAGDGGALITDDEDLYLRAFAIHDHGARPDRVGVADAASFLGLNFRMHELTGAVAGVQARRLPAILERLRVNKRKLLERIGDLPGVSPAHNHDPEGDCGTVLPFVFEDAAVARAVAHALHGITLSESGKHNYANVPQLRGHALPAGSCPASCEFYAWRGDYGPGALPRTDDVLRRTVALSVGVVDSYLGTGFGTNILSDDAEIDQVAQTFRDTILSVSGGAR